MLKSLLILTAAAVTATAESGYETVSDGLTFETSDEQQHVDRQRILAEIHGGQVEKREGGRPIARRLRRVKKVNLDEKEMGRDLDADLVSF